ncbi:hypothetical protein ACEN9H_09260 [Massilia cellulosiltytica]
MIRARVVPTPKFRFDDDPMFSLPPACTWSMVCLTAASWNQEPATS